VDVDERLMARALALAARGAGETQPNPAVGCVIARGGQVVGQGWHRRAGGPHAEVFALREAGSRAHGATAYVTLEPCAHQGRTGPCAPLLAAAGIARVVVALRDPNPRVGGRGLRLLRAAGVAVEVGPGAAEARRLNEPFLGAMRLARPWIALKAAPTLDGRIATPAGESKWLTSPAQRREARRLRRRYDGLLVGIGTVLADDPLLLPEPRTRRPYHRVVLDSAARLPVAGRLASSAGEHPVWVVTREDAGAARARTLEAAGVRVLRVAGGADGRVALAPALRALRDAGLLSLLVEGGGEVLGALVRERLFDELRLFRAPLLMGGRGSRPAFGGPDPASLAEAVRLRRGDPGPGFTHELWYPERGRESS
jgi:diaminohydroxyphosphoribosylaminopyrimidine deaminase/5-amino-6-(5-phosphoribosylamino)uracil reductase